MTTIKKEISCPYCKFINQTEIEIEEEGNFQKSIQCKECWKKFYIAGETEVNKFIYYTEYKS